MQTIKMYLFTGVTVFLLFFVIGCRGTISEKRPIHLNPNMDVQPKYKPYSQSDWFKDGRTMRSLVEGVVAKGYLKEDDHYSKGRYNEEFVDQFPEKIKISKDFLKTGQERFDIYCACCHAQSGNGDGLVGRRMLSKPMSLHTEYMYNISKGRLFDIISNGSRTMPAHNVQINEYDRWAIVAYINALQICQNADGER